MTRQLLALASGVASLLQLAPARLLAEDTPSSHQVDAVCIDSDLAGVLKILADGDTVAIDNRVRRPLSGFRLTSPSALPGDALAAGLTELLRLRGVAVTRGATGIVAEDTPDPSEAIVLSVRDKPLRERVPQLLASLHDSDGAKSRFAASDMPLSDVLMILQLITGCPVIVDDPLPRARFSSPDSTRDRTDILAEIDAFLVKKGVYLVQHDARFLTVVCAPTLLTKDQASPEPEGMTEDEIKQRMERVAAEIRARREKRQKMLEGSATGSPSPAQARP